VARIEVKEGGRGETLSTPVSSKPATTTSPSNSNLQQEVSRARGPSAGGWASARRAVSTVFELVSNGAPTPCMDQYCRRFCRGPIHPGNSLVDKFYGVKGVFVGRRNGLIKSRRSQAVHLRQGLHHGEVWWTMARSMTLLANVLPLSQLILAMHEDVSLHRSILPDIVQW